MDEKIDFRVQKIPASAEDDPSNDYYEGILFSDGLPKPVPEFPPPPDPDELPALEEEYEDVEVNEFFDSINVTESEAWRPWTTDGKQRMGGYVITYPGDLHYLTIRGSGHMVPVSG